MSGFYNNWFKVQHPNVSNEITPMASGGYQPPFFFGASQVPTSLKLSGTDMDIGGRGVGYYMKDSFMPESRGKGVQVTRTAGHSNIRLPRHIGSLRTHM